MVIKPIIQVTSKKFLALFWLIMLSQANLYRRLRRVPRVKRKDFPALSLQGVERVLIIAPHPDDETIGAGGLIQAARSRGAEVRVVIVTNGDGQAFAPLALNRCLLPRTKDYVALGERRQKETVNALGLLGLVQEDVHFLGYPDRQLATLWAANWTSDFPLQAGLTQARRSPYRSTYNPGSRYCGNDLLNDLRTIIHQYRPDFIVIPHSKDEHPDHRALSDFAQMAISLECEAHPRYQPSAWSYLIHYGHYPQPRGIRPESVLLPPLPLVVDENPWYRLDLSREEMDKKVAAIRQHASQVLLLGNFLPSFGRQNECFSPIPISLNTLVNGSSVSSAVPIDQELALLPGPSSD